MGRVSIPGQEAQAEVSAGRQQAKHRNSSFWKDAGKHSEPGRGPGAAAEQGTAGTRAASRWAGEDLLGQGKQHTAYVEPPALTRWLKWLEVFFPHSHH